MREDSTNCLEKPMVTSDFQDRMTVRCGEKPTVARYRPDYSSSTRRLERMATLPMRPR